MSTALRADAQRNLGRILEAAGDAYAELGPDVTIDEIARRAGVGHGTVFRRFPTKDALRAAVIRARLDELLAHARELLEESDAGAALERFVWHVAESCRRDRALFESIEKCESFADVAEAKGELHDMGNRLIRHAQRAGSTPGTSGRWSVRRSRPRCTPSATTPGGATSRSSSTASAASPPNGFARRGGRFAARYFARGAGRERPAGARRPPPRPPRGGARSASTR
jgi:AcrR family transcriptional regulator